MWRYLLLSGVIIFSAVQAPSLFEMVIKERENSKQQEIAQDNARFIALANAQKQTKKTYNSGRQVKLKAGRGGHFYAQVRMNNRPVDVMVDTGATTVAINETTARNLGIRLKSSDFKYTVNTANGTKKAAIAMIDQIQIGNIRIYDVRASISRDTSLSTTLLGMSFLKQLKRFEVSGDTMTMVQ
ncbi:MAG: TIGR02281 family clan AA aspartic protease [Rhizobiaceae bacterium]|nr:TIGR02281 family clan AA aspartic protease [Rhizobiaceae bacterium]